MSQTKTSSRLPSMAERARVWVRSRRADGATTSSVASRISTWLSRPRRYWRRERAEQLHLPYLPTVEGTHDALEELSMGLGVAMHACLAALDGAPRPRRRILRRRRRTDRVYEALTQLLAAMVLPLGGEMPAETSPFVFTVRDRAAGILFRPWTNGHAVGFRCVLNDATKPQYVYLVPSSGWSGAGGMVCVHRGSAGVPERDPIIFRHPISESSAVVAFPTDDDDRSPAA